MSHEIIIFWHFRRKQIKETNLILKLSQEAALFQAWSPRAFAVYKAREVGVYVGNLGFRNTFSESKTLNI